MSKSVHKINGSDDLLPDIDITHDDVIRIYQDDVPVEGGFYGPNQVDPPTQKKWVAESTGDLMTLVWEGLDRDDIWSMMGSCAEDLTTLWGMRIHHQAINKQDIDTVLHELTIKKTKSGYKITASFYVDPDQTLTVDQEWRD